MSDDILDMLHDSASAFAGADPGRARRHRGLAPYYDAQAWREIARQGWLSILVPEESGGLGLGIEPATIVARAFGRHALCEPFVAVGVLAAVSLAAAAQSDQAAAGLAGLLAGERTVGVCWQGVRGEIDPFDEAICVVEAAGRRALRGTGRFVAVPTADAFVVLAYHGEEAALYWVEADAPGLSIRHEAAADGTALGEMEFADVAVIDADRLVSGENAKAVLRRALDAAAIAVAAELLGVMDGALEMTTDYLRTRQQFGVAIGSFQSLQHRAVDLWIQREITEAAIKAAAHAFDDADTHDVERSALASGAKARAAQAAVTLCNQALQLHGAIGFADEYGLGLYLNRALSLAAWLGNAAQHRRRFASLMPVEQRQSRAAGAA
jgi:alkylation response protein AidB-like acyl-CoA dehydrogenase